jgi:hypothetical protein
MRLPVRPVQKPGSTRLKILTGIFIPSRVVMRAREAMIKSGVMFDSLSIFFYVSHGGTPFAHPMIELKKIGPFFE